jgi:hypothetical protein
MKTKLIAFVLALLVASLSFGQKQKKFRFPNVSHDVKKEAKRYKKEGWKVFPGNAPIGQQLDNAFRKQAETSEDGFPKWVVANGSSVAQTQAAAEMQAIELGKNRLVGLLQTHMKAVIESDVANNQLDAKEAASITKTIEVSANRVSKKLGRVAPLFKVYRPIGQNIEVQVLLGYSYEMAQKEIIEEMKYELQLETDDVRKRYEKYLNPENYKEGEIKNYTDTDK